MIGQSVSIHRRYCVLREYITRQLPVIAESEVYYTNITEPGRRTTLFLWLKWTDWPCVNYQDDTQEGKMMRNLGNFSLLQDWSRYIQWIWFNGILYLNYVNGKNIIFPWDKPRYDDRMNWYWLYYVNECVNWCI